MSSSVDPEPNASNNAEAIFATIEEQQPSTRQKVFHSKTIDLNNCVKKCYYIRNNNVRKFISELLATFMLVTFGCGSVAQYVLFNSLTERTVTFLSVNFGFGIGGTLGVIVGGRISGAHMNPAVSFSMFLVGRLTLFQLGIYCLGQCLGAFLGAVVVYAVYIDSILKYGDKIGASAFDKTTAGIFATYPQKDLFPLASLADQIISTALLIFVVQALSDKNNLSDLASETGAMLVGMTIFTIGVSFGFNCGYAVNPARDLMPRIFTCMAGWGGKPFVYGNYFFWIPIVGPFIGSILGTLIYVSMISNNWPPLEIILENRL